LVFWNWILAGVQGSISRADGSVILLNENRVEVMRWNFRRAWPCKYTGPSFNAANNEISMETLEICHEGLEIDQ
jgi:phage tail-like protein